ERGRAGAREPEDEDRAPDLRAADRRVALQLVDDLEAADEVAEQLLVDEPPSEPREPRVLRVGLEQHRERGLEARVAAVRGARGLRRGGEPGGALARGTVRRRPALSGARAARRAPGGPAARRWARGPRARPRRRRASSPSRARAAPGAARRRAGRGRSPAGTPRARPSRRGSRPRAGRAAGARGPRGRRAR